MRFVSTLPSPLSLLTPFSAGPCGSATAPASQRRRSVAAVARRALSQALCVLAWPLAALAQPAAPAQAAPGIRLPAGEQLIDLRMGQAIGVDALLAEMRQADVVLLGELHDASAHHQRRAALLAALGPGAVVVAEQLTRGQLLARGDALLLDRLSAAGFEPKAWPLHQPLFAAIEAAGLPLRGGNLDRETTRRVVREGAAALPPDLAPLLRSAPLAAAAEQALDDELLRGHCGQLSAARLPAMRLAQRARDAAMWQALATSGGRPAVLVAGNGHVRLDYGVAQLALQLSPRLRLVSVGFGELGDALPNQAAAPATTHLWLTPVQPRGDPCADLQMPAGLAKGAAAAADAASASAPAAR